ncbi:MAG: hypothetical protein V3U79_04800 [Dehalococcoidia bacterium]
MMHISHSPLLVRRNRPPAGSTGTDDPEKADELLEMAHAHRPWARVTIYDEEGRVLRRVKPRNWVDEAREVN